MSERSIEHATFVVERSYHASPARVFAAWSDPSAKARWFGSDTREFELDFRVGGRELNRGTGPDGSSYTFAALYQDIVPDERIVYTYDMHLDETRISVSVATVEFKSQGSGTTLVFTEQSAFLDGHDTPAQREQGTGGLLEALGKELEGETAGA
jgi:uncharacterized protein YndB with AHSA1/START domain